MKKLVKSFTLNVRIDEDMLRAIYDLCVKFNCTKSDLIRNLIMEEYQKRN